MVPPSAPLPAPMAAPTPGFPEAAPMAAPRPASSFYGVGPLGGAAEGGTTVNHPLVHSLTYG